MNGESQEETFRRLEVERMASQLPRRGRVLEIGGGTGWQARLLEARGLDVRSFDLPGRDRSSVYFPVSEYDGRHLPTGDGSIDVLWSSNVLEHVEDLETLTREMTRVVSEGGVAVHVLPTPWWRLWSSIVYPVASAKRQLQNCARAGHGPPASGGAHDERSFGRKVKSLALPGPHGAAPSALAELWGWRRSAWRRRLEVDGWELTAVVPQGYFYTGNAFAPSMRLATRAALAHVLGPATQAFVLRRRSD